VDLDPSDVLVDELDELLLVLSEFFFWSPFLSCPPQRQYFAGIACGWIRTVDFELSEVMVLVLVVRLLSFIPFPLFTVAVVVHYPYAINLLDKTQEKTRTALSVTVTVLVLCELLFMVFVTTFVSTCTSVFTCTWVFVTVTVLESLLFELFEEDLLDLLDELSFPFPCLDEEDWLEL
jgi:hypothetical protein